MNIAYRWFIGYDIDIPIPHCATSSYAFAARFPSKVFEKIYSWIQEEAVEKGLVKTKTVFIDATHVKTNANRKKKRRGLTQRTAHSYDEQLRAEIESDRAVRGKKPLEGRDDDDTDSDMKTETSPTREVDCSAKASIKWNLFTQHNAACDENNFVLTMETTAGNIQDSRVFDAVNDAFPNVEIVAADAGSKTPWICKKVIDGGRNISTPYKRPMTGKRFSEAMTMCMTNTTIV